MAVRFAGTTDQWTYSGTLPTTTAGISVVFWVYLSVDRNDWSCMTRLSASGTSIVYLTTDGSGTSVGWFSGGGSITTGVNLTVGAWHRIAATHNAGSGTLYIATAGGTTGVHTGTITTGSPGDLGIGGRGPGDSSEPFNGRVGAYKLYTGTLTQAEVEAEWQQITPRRVAGLHAWYPLLDATSGGRVDYSGAGRGLTASATAATTEDGPPIPWDAPHPVLLLPTGSGASTAAQGTAHTGLVTLAAARKVAPLGGTCGLATVLTGAARKQAPTAGAVTITGAATAAATKTSPGRGSSAGFLAATGSATKTAAGAGVTPLHSGSGAQATKTAPTAGHSWGSWAAAATATKITPHVGLSPLGFTALHAGPTARVAAGHTSIGGASAGQARKLSTLTAATSVLVTSSGLLTKHAAGSGTGLLPVAATARGGKRAPGSGLTVLPLVSTGATTPVVTRGAITHAHRYDVPMIGATPRSAPTITGG